MLVPESAVVAAASYLYRAYEGIIAAATAVRLENPNAVAVALQYTHAQLAAIEAILVAVTEEQPKKETHESS